jgi:hypothetical protein
MVDYRSWDSDDGRKARKMKDLKYVAVLGRDREGRVIVYTKA